MQEIDLQELKSKIEGDIDITDETLNKYSHDASIFEIKPKVVISPKNIKDLKNIVLFARKYSNVNITARSAGTDMSGGPLNNSIILDFLKYFNHIKEVGEGYAITEPGVFYRDFDKATKEFGGQILPSYTASRELCTVGGMVANNSGGEKNIKYGKTENYVKSLKMVLSDGNEVTFEPLNMVQLKQKMGQGDLEGQIYKNMYELIDANYDLLSKAKPIVSKNSCGYYVWNVWDKDRGIFDLTKMIVGSQGTLGLITEIKFALIKPQTHSRLLVIFLKDLRLLADTVTHVLRFNPESFESYDDHTFKIALKFMPQLIKQMGGNILKLGFEFVPEMLSVIEGGVPKLVLMAEFTADTDEQALHLATQAQDSLRDLHEKSRITNTGDDTKKYWVIRRESFNMLRQHSGDLRTAPFIDDFAVRPERLPEFLPQLYKILDTYDLTYTIAGHVGDGNFHIIPLMDLHAEESLQIIRELSMKVYELVLAFGGTITAEHNDGIIRTPFIKMQYGEDVYRLFEKVKSIWDPKNIFNPGKKVGGTLEHLLDNVAR